MTITEKSVHTHIPPPRPKETLSETIKRRVASDPVTIRDKRTMWEKWRVLMR